jgi:ABC-type uncharacterized transport system auxiliary subunit
MEMMKNFSLILKNLFPLVIILLFIGLSGCINIKSDYPQVEYYMLNQEATTFKNTATIEGTLQIRNFAVNEQLESNYLLALKDDNSIQKYYYHRWITDLSSLTTDFIITRFNNLKAFTGGVIRASGMLTPDYILEGQILEFNARNVENSEKQKPYISVNIQVSLVKRIPFQTDIHLILNKVYSLKINRESNNVSTIAPAFSKAVSQITDILMNDIQESIARLSK